MTYKAKKIILLSLITATLILVAVLLISNIPVNQGAEEGPIIIPIDYIEEEKTEPEPEPIKKEEEPIENHAGQIIYLTFDDGPGQYTKELLDILDQYNVKATFFVTNQYPEYTPLIKDIYGRGHKVGVHTYSHNYEYIYTSVENYITDYNAMNDIIYKYTGDYSNFFRFPGGTSNMVHKKYNPTIMQDLTSLFTSYNILWYDWNIDATTQDIYQTAASHKQSVVLMHDVRNEDIEKVKILLPKALKSGYEFRLLDETIYCQHTIK